MFKCTRLKKDANVEKMKIFSKMKTEANHDEWLKLKVRYDAYDKMENPSGYICKSDMLAATASLASILLVLHFEKLNIITSKCWNWIKPKKL